MQKICVLSSAVKKLRKKMFILLPFFSIMLDFKEAAFLK